MLCSPDPRQSNVILSGGCGKTRMRDSLASFSVAQSKSPLCRPEPDKDGAPTRLSSIYLLVGELYGQLAFGLRHFAPEFLQVGLDCGVFRIFAQREREPAICGGKVARGAQSG